MCLLLANQSVLDAFTHLTRIGVNKNDVCQKKIIQFAAEANLETSGPLDSMAGGLKHMPDDLKHIRHYVVGTRHRVYVSGSHKNCQYSAWHVKEFKRNGKDVEGSKAFNKTLYAALNNPASYVLSLDESGKAVAGKLVDP